MHSCYSAGAGAVYDDGLCVYPTAVADVIVAEVLAVLSVTVAKFTLGVMVVDVLVGSEKSDISIVQMCGEPLTIFLNAACNPPAVVLLSRANDA